MYCSGEKWTWRVNENYTYLKWKVLGREIVEKGTHQTSGEGVQK